MNLTATAVLLAAAITAGDSPASADVSFPEQLESILTRASCVWNAPPRGVISATMTRGPLLGDGGVGVTAVSDSHALSLLTPSKTAHAAAAAPPAADRPESGDEAPVGNTQAEVADDSAAIQPASGLNGSAPESRAVLAMLEKSGYTLTPAVKAAYVAMRKTQALAEIAKAGCSVPEEFLAWIDATPVVATTIYALENPRACRIADPHATNKRKPYLYTNDTPGQRLAMLRSLDIDLGPDEVRRTHTQLALALTHLYAGCVDKATMSNEKQMIGLRPRGLFKLEIPKDPRVRIDTRAKDRPLDMYDHIINFFEEHPVVKDVKIAKGADGNKVAATEKRSRPLYACELMKNPQLQEQFSVYMKAHGYDIPPGKAKFSPGAFSMFLKAYEEKGLMPSRRDPAPTPVEKMAYLVRNDNFRFPAGVKRGWPKFPLNSPWPILGWIAGSGESLREREFIWGRFRDHGSAVGYGRYVGSIAQVIWALRATSLQPFEFCYDTYPMRLKDGGVCGTMSNIARGLNIALGIPSSQASQPGHSCVVAIRGNEEKGFSLSIGQSVGSPTFVSGVGRYELAVVRFILPVNYGLMPLLDSKVALQLARALPASVSAKDRQAMLLSAFEANPYNLEAVTAIFSSLESPRQAAGFWQRFNTTLAKVDRPGCPKTSSYDSFVVKGIFDAGLAKLPPPADKADVEFVAACLADRSDALWLKYQLAASSVPVMKDKLAADLKAAVTGPRTPHSCTRLSERITQLGGAIGNVAEKKAWANQLLAMIGDNTMYTVGEGRKTRRLTDPCAATLRALAGNSPDARLEFEKDLKTAVEGPRAPAGCDLMVKRLAAIAKDFKNRVERTAWANTLQNIMNGHETFAPVNAPHHSQMLDPLVKEIYALGCDLGPVMQQFEADLKASLENGRQAGPATLLSKRLLIISKRLRNHKQRKAWGETLFGIINGHETFAPNPKYPAKLTLDPCVAAIYAFGPNLAPAKTKLEADLKASLDGARTADSAAIFSHRLSALLTATKNRNEKKAWAETLLPLFAGKEFYTVKLPKNQEDKEAEDPCARLIYRTLGKKVPARPAQVNAAAKADQPLPPPSISSKKEKQS